MNVSDCLTPAEIEPEPDSPIPIRRARRTVGAAHLWPVNRTNSLSCFNIARKGHAHEPDVWLLALGCSYPASAPLPRDPGVIAH